MPRFKTSCEFYEVAYLFKSMKTFLGDLFVLSVVLDLGTMGNFQTSKFQYIDSLNKEDAV